MDDNKNIKFTDYVKLENIKGLLTSHLEQMGFREQVRTMNDKDIAKLIMVMAQLGEVLREKEEDKDKIDFLITYIVGLWTRLIVDYGAGLEDL